MYIKKKIRKQEIGTVSKEVQRQKQPTIHFEIVNRSWIIMKTVWKQERKINNKLID